MEHELKGIRYQSRTYIPKANGKLRPLGIPAYEDRLVQSVMAEVLTDIYEERFLECVPMDSDRTGTRIRS